MSRRLSPWIPGLAVGLAGLLLTFRALLVPGRSNRLWGNWIDPALIHWIAEWGYHALFEELNPALFWQANIHYPATYATAYTDSMLGLQIFYGPLRLLGAEPLAALYSSLALIAMVGILLTQHALHRLGMFTATEQAVILFAAHFSLCVTNFFNHYQLFGFHLAPAFFILLYVYLRDFEVGDLTLLCVAFCLGVSMSLYLGPFLVTMCVFLVPACLLPRIQEFGFRGVARRIGLIAPLVVSGFAVGLYFVQLRPYLLVASRFEPPGIEIWNRYSAVARDLILSPSRHSLWFPGDHSLPIAYGESTYFPGYLLLVGLAGALVVAGHRVLQRRRALSIDRPVQSASELSFLLHSLLLFVAALALSWGPSWHPQHLSGWLPFPLLSEVVPGLGQIRAPGRFGIFLGLPLGVFLVTAMRAIPIEPRSRRVLGALVLMVLAIESLTRFELFPHEVDPKGTYRRVADILPRHAPLIEVPIDGADHLSHLRGILKQIGGSTIHWGRLMIGYGAHRTLEHRELVMLDRGFRQGRQPPSRLLAFARRNDIEFLLIHLRSYDAKHRTLWKPVLRREKVLMRHRGSVLVQLSQP